MFPPGVGRWRSAAPVPPAATAEAGADLGPAERALGAGPVVLMGGSLMAADTQRVRRRHRFTHGVDDRPPRRGAGEDVTFPTYPSTAPGAAQRAI